MIRFTVILMLALTGCIAQGPIYSDAPLAKNEQGLVYIYRAKSDCGNGGSFWISIDGSKHAVLSVGEYTYFYASKNTYFLGFKNPNYLASGQNLKVERNEKVYIKYEIVMVRRSIGGAGFFVSPICEHRYTRVSEEEVLAEIVSYTLSMGKRVDY